MGGLVCVSPSVGCCRYSGVRGGGKCPEEEHTTCSGGPTMILSQARFTGREKL
jgi:hypothetical protein